MTTTAGTVAQRALKKILVQSGDAPLEADEYADFFEDMNFYMAALESEGVLLGYTPVDNVSDVVTVPAGAIRGIIANVAVEVAPDYGASVSGELARQAKSGMRIMRKIGAHMGAMSMPTTLPVGSGNEDISLRTYQYYSDPEVALLTLAGNTLATALVTPALSTPTKVNAFWSVENFTGFTADITGKITNAKTGAVTSAAEIELWITGGGDYNIYLAKNGTVITASVISATLTSTKSQVLLDYTEEVDPGDYLEIYISAETVQADAIIVDGQFRIT
jgi:hypothetical protein